MALTCGSQATNGVVRTHGLVADLVEKHIGAEECVTHHSDVNDGAQQMAEGGGEMLLVSGNEEKGCHAQGYHMRRN